MTEYVLGLYRIHLCPFSFFLFFLLFFWGGLKHSKFALCIFVPPLKALQAYPVVVSDCRIMQHPVNPCHFKLGQGTESCKLDTDTSVHTPNWG